MRLFTTMAVIIGCYACSDAHLLRQGVTITEAGDTTPKTDPNEADAKADPTGTISEALGGDRPGGIFKSLDDAAKGKGDVRETKTLAFVANKKPDDQQITYGSQNESRNITMESTRMARTYQGTTDPLNIRSESFTQGDAMQLPQGPEKLP